MNTRHTRRSGWYVIAIAVVELLLLGCSRPVSMNRVGRAEGIPPRPAAAQVEPLPRAVERQWTVVRTLTTQGSAYVAGQHVLISNGRGISTYEPPRFEQSNPLQLPERTPFPGDMQPGETPITGLRALLASTRALYA